jgi:hypothetical protein
MITVRPVEYAPGVALKIRLPGPGSQWLNVSRRVTRTPTLDGGAALADGGFSDADRILELAVTDATVAQIQTMTSFIQLYPRLNVTTIEGVFVCAPRQLDVEEGAATLTLLALSKR